MLDRRGSIPVTLLVILTVVIFGFALLMFFLALDRAEGDVKGYQTVEKYSLKVNGDLFGGGDGNVVPEDKMVSAWRADLFGWFGEVLKVRVEGLK